MNVHCTAATPSLALVEVVDVLGRVVRDERAERVLEDHGRARDAARRRRQR